jgi:hypothetical protein
VYRDEEEKGKVHNFKPGVRVRNKIEDRSGTIAPLRGPGAWQSLFLVQVRYYDGQHKDEPAERLEICGSEDSNDTQ